MNSVDSHKSNGSDILHNNEELPINMRFTSSNIISITFYTVLLIISTIGNFYVLATLCQRYRTRKSKINLMIIHLAIADLCVTFLNMPLEIAWKATVTWNAGDFMCRIMSFFRIFGLYLSSFILICISVDRYSAVKHPLHVQQTHRRVTCMLVSSWLLAIICSTPQMYVFHVETHENHTWYEQCVTFGTFNNRFDELSYNMLAFVGTYAIPLVVILKCYGGILLELHGQCQKKNRDETNSVPRSSELRLRRFGVGNIGRAKIQTIKMTLLIVVTFIICWTPYYVMSLWHWFCPSSARKVDQRVQETLFIFAVSNSCVNPFLYGYYSFNVNPRRFCLPNSCFKVLHDRLTRNSVTMCDVSRTKRSQIRSVANKKDPDINPNEIMIRLEDVNVVTAGPTITAV